MASNSTGKFCEQCSLSVIDFTVLSDSQIIDTLQNRKGRICARVDKSQIERSLSLNHENYTFSGLYKLLIGLILLGNADQTVASDVKTETVDPNLMDDSIVGQTFVNEHDSLKNIIKGRIYDKESKEPIPFASIKIENTEIGAICDKEGNFRIVVPENTPDNFVLVGYAVGYDPEAMKINKRDLPLLNQKINLFFGPSLLGEVEIVKKRKWWQRKPKC